MSGPEGAGASAPARGCACGFDRPDVLMWSHGWHVLHRDHHLATFPDVDQGTRDNLQASAERAEMRDVRTYAGSVNLTEAIIEIQSAGGMVEP